MTVSLVKVCTHERIVDITMLCDPQLRRRCIDCGVEWLEGHPAVWATFVADVTAAIRDDVEREAL